MVFWITQPVSHLQTCNNGKTTGYFEIRWKDNTFLSLICFFSSYFPHSFAIASPSTKTSPHLQRIYEQSFLNSRFRSRKNRRHLIFSKFISRLMASLPFKRTSVLFFTLPIFTALFSYCHVLNSYRYKKKSIIWRKRHLSARCMGCGKS
jgi:hypothetical protein